MSSGFDYSKWDKIELSDDEDDVHPNIDKDSWFRMKHRSRVEREENEDKETASIKKGMEKANQRIKVLEHELIKLDKLVTQDVTEAVAEDDHDDDDLDDREGLEAELEELKLANARRADRLEEIVKNKKWNVDNICEVKEERTIINQNAATTNYTPTGFAKSKDEDGAVQEMASKQKEVANNSATASHTKPAATKSTTATAATATTESKPTATVVGPAAQPMLPERDSGAMETYHDFTVKYADIVEEFMHCDSLQASADILKKHGDVLLQENASNYLLLASLEDEMNGFREKMKQTARQSQIISNIAELAKSMGTHPGNVIIPFFSKLDNKQFYDGFMDGVNAFIDKIIKRSVTKKIEMDAQQEEEEAKYLADIPAEERLGPGGLDPLEVIETLPQAMQDAFASRDIDRLKDVLLQMPPEEAEKHMKACVDSGLWCPGD